MDDLVANALAANRENRSIEFKQGFDPQSPGDWCEVIKDLVAIANSGGGIIIFGLDSSGNPSGQPTDAIAAIDPADVANKVSRYTGPVDFDFEIRTLEKGQQKLVGFVIPGVGIPLVFQKPGTYDVGGGKQKTAFGVGTVYFRHGAKSEPGTSDDIRRVIERQLEGIRKSWVKGVRKVVTAPAGAQIITVVASAKNTPSSRVTIVKDPSAIPVRLTRDPGQASGTFLHEEISTAIFDEINNVIDANRVLGRGSKDFLLGAPVYYRVYAERQHVKQPEDVLAALLRNGLAEFYAPALFWSLSLPDAALITTLSYMFLYPTSRHAHSLMRIGIALGPEFSEWLLSKWTEKWRKHPQPPNFFFTLKKSVAAMKASDPLILAARISPSTKIELNGEPPALVRDLIASPEQAAALLSKVCVNIFQGNSDQMSLARSLDYIAYGPAIKVRGAAIAKGVSKEIGDRKPTNVSETAEAA